jgi:predicted nucleic acid-binding protein
MSGVLIDTSVWIDHFRNRNETLENLLNQDLALTHPMVIGEIACGTLPAPRPQTLADLGLLSMVQHASLHETMAFIERESMYGMGCGLVDMILLTSTLITPGATLWTLDKRLATLAEQFGVAHRASSSAMTVSLINLL